MGGGLKVISTTLFGARDMQERYQPYLPCALRAHHNLFSGWEYRIYHDGRIHLGPYGVALLALQEAKLVKLVFVDSAAWIEKAMLWRLLPLWDTDVELFIIRDIDMVACWRERRIEEEWLRSGLPVHAISDYRGHHDFPSLNGMMGFRNAEARQLLDAGPGRNAYNIERLFARAPWSRDNWCSNYRASGPGADPKHRVSKDTTNNQHFLREYVWARTQHRACEHRLSGTKTFDAALTRTEVAPFHGDHLGVSAAVRGGSDPLIPFIGASMANSKIDLAKISAFYKQYGDPVMEYLIAGCEKEVGG